MDEKQRARDLEQAEGKELSQMCGVQNNRYIDVIWLRYLMLDPSLHVLPFFFVQEDEQNRNNKLKSA